MNTFTDTLLNSFKYIKTIGIADALDILLVAFIIYQVVLLIQRSNTGRLAGGIIVILFALWLSGILRFTMINFLLRKAVELGLIAIVIIFQPELRRFLEKVGSGRLTAVFGTGVHARHTDGAITQTVLACADLSRSRTGALIIFERDNQLSDPISTGTLIDAQITAELLKNIFFVKAPLHDGAVIVKNGRLAAAGCMLPLSTNMNLSKELGMRHRAGIGMSERSDAVVVIVSEETGSISVAVDGMLKRHLSPETVERLLRKELTSETEELSHRKNPLDLIRGKKHE